MRSRTLLVVGVAFGLALTACSSGYSREQAVASFQRANPDASINEAACVVDALIEEYEGEPVDESSLDGLEAELLAEPQSDRFQLDQFRAEFGCGMIDDVEGQLRRELLANEIDESAVDCVAESLARRLTDDDLEILIGSDGSSDGTMTDSFYTSFFTSVESCDALPN